MQLIISCTNLPVRLSPLGAEQEVPKDVDSEDVEVVSEEDIENEELTDSIQCV